MSGDVQPRKRKDKKRRKDEGEQILTQSTPHSPTATTPPTDDVNIHVHKEGGTGGGICAKLVFFVLLSALVVVIGMIITQYRGLSDVDTVDSESKFAQFFEGWIDTGHRHDDHDVDEPIDEHDHEEDEEDVSQNEDEGHEESEEDLSEENEDEDDEDEDENEDEEPIVSHSEEEQPVEDSDENSLTEEDENEDVSEEKSFYRRDDENEDASEERSIYGKDDENEDASEENSVYRRHELHKRNVEQAYEDEDHAEDEQELQNMSTEEEDEDDDGSPEKASKEDGADGSDEKTSTTKESLSGEKKQQESAGMAVKLGVGVALLVVAHLVLVRKWRSSAPVEKPKPSDEEIKEPTPDLSRRNTIVAPPTLQEVEPDIEQDEEDYSEEEVSEEESHPESKSAKTRYQELRSTYTRSLTPEGEIDYHKEPETYEEEYDEEEEEDVSEEEEEEEEDEEDEGDSENEEYDDDEDEELLKRLEAKYGKLHGDKIAGSTTKKAGDSDDEAEYEHSDITSKEDYKIKEKLDEAQKSAKNNSAYAIKLFDTILQNYPNSPRGIYGKALSLDYLADQKRSNDILDQALEHYVKLLNIPDVPDALFETAAELCIERMRFVGQYKNAINIHWKLIERFPKKSKHSTSLAISFLTINRFVSLVLDAIVNNTKVDSPLYRVDKARAILKDVLSKWPKDGVALAHYGFILKTTDNNLKEAVKYLKKGLDSKEKGVIDGRFYFHLGDALARLGKPDEAMKIYEEGVKHKVFLSKYQRSLYNVPRLTGKPWWDTESLPYDLFQLLTKHWQKIRDEGLAVLNSRALFQDESENLKDTGTWKQFELYARGQRNVHNCNRCPFTCSVVEKISDAKGCKRGQTKFSVIHPGTHVWPHCGPTNCRLRVHLGLKVPPKTFIRVADDIRSWKEGKVFVFDDSFEHEVWHNGSDFRLVLIVDVWHPELTPTEKRNLSPI